MSMHRRTNSYLFLIPISIIVLLALACDLSGFTTSSEGSEEGAMQLATQEQGLDSSQQGSEDGSSSSMEYPLKNPPPECIIPQQVLDEKLVMDMPPPEPTILMECPSTVPWDVDLIIDVWWKGEQPFGYYEIKPYYPALVHLEILPNGLVLMQNEKEQYAVTVTGEQDFGDQKCSQEGDGYYDIKVSGYCMHGLVVLNEIEMEFIEESKLKLVCDDAEIKTDMWAPNAAPVIDLCFYAAEYPAYHRITLNYPSPQGFLLSDWDLLVPKDRTFVEPVPLIPDADQDN